LRRRRAGAGPHPQPQRPRALHRFLGPRDLAGLPRSGPRRPDDLRGPRPERGPDDVRKPGPPGSAHQPFEGRVGRARHPRRHARQHLPADVPEVSSPQPRPDLKEPPMKLSLAFLLALLGMPQEETKTLAIGDPAPDFSLPGVDGKTHSLAD